MKGVVSIKTSLISVLIILAVSLLLSNVQHSTTREYNLTTNISSSCEETVYYDIFAYTDTRDPNDYAYMDLETADESLKAKILEARNKIILSESWAADGIYAYVSDPDGNIVNVLPQFSELFPSDWDVPIILDEP